MPKKEGGSEGGVDTPTHTMIYLFTGNEPLQDMLARELDKILALIKGSSQNFPSIMKDILDKLTEKQYIPLL